MFFLIKCAFWLGIVFYCLPWPTQERPEAVARHAAGTIVAQAQKAVVDRALAACSSNPRACLEFARAASDGHAASASRSKLRHAIAD